MVLLSKPTLIETKNPCNRNEGIKTEVIQIKKSKLNDDNSFTVVPNGYSSTVTTKYDTEGHILNETIASKDFKYETIYLYDSGVHILSLNQTIHTGFIESVRNDTVKVVSRDKYGRATTRRTVGMTSLMETKYNNCSNEIHSVYNSNKELVKKDIFRFKENYLSKREIINYNKADSTRIVIGYNNYRFDSKGNWIYRVQQEGEQYFVETREVIYHD